MGIDRNVQLAVGEESYGLFYALFSFSFWLQIVLDPGLDTFTKRGLAHNPSQLSKYISSFIPLKLGLALLYVLISAIGGWILGYNAHSMYLLGWILLNQALASFILYMRANLSGLHKFNIDSLFSVMDRGLMIIFCSILLWGNFFNTPFTIEWYIYAQSLAYAITALAAFITVFKYSTFFKPKINTTYLRVILRESYPYALLGILMTLYTRVDALMIERLLPNGKLQAGIYAQAYRLLDAFNMVAFLFATILLPVFTGMIKRKESVQHTVKTTYSLLMIPSFLLGLSSYYFRDEIMTLLYNTQATPYLGVVFGFLMFTQLSISTVYIYGTLLTANGSIRFLNYVSGAGVLVNVILNFWLINQYGALGAVIATLVTQMIVSGAQLIKAHAIFGMGVSFKELSKTGIFILLAFVTFHWGHSLIGSWIGSMLILCCINLTFALILKLINPGFFLQLLKFKNK